MPNEDLHLRVARVERETESFRKTIAELTVTLALLEQTMRSVREVEAQRGGFNQKLLFFAFGVLISAAMTFVVKGGLVI